MLELDHVIREINVRPPMCDYYAKTHFYVTQCYSVYYDRIVELLDGTIDEINYITVTGTHIYLIAQLRVHLRPLSGVSERSGKAQSRYTARKLTQRPRKLKHRGRGKTN
jgi:hypothetical protein